MGVGVAVQQLVPRRQDVKENRYCSSGGQQATVEPQMRCVVEMVDLK